MENKFFLPRPVSYFRASISGMNRIFPQRFFFIAAEEKVLAEKCAGVAPINVHKNHNKKIHSVFMAGSLKAAVTFPPFYADLPQVGPGNMLFGVAARVLRGLWSVALADHSECIDTRRSTRRHQFCGSYELLIDFKISCRINIMFKWNDENMYCKLFFHDISKSIFLLQ